MLGQRLNFENPQSEKAIVDWVTASTPVSLVTTGLVGALLLVLSGCGTSTRAYYYDETADHFRFYRTTSDEVLLVSPAGQVVDATSVAIDTHGYAYVAEKDKDPISDVSAKPEVPDTELLWSPWVPSEEGPVVWIDREKPDGPSILRVVGTTIWKDEIQDWDMTDFEITSERVGQEGCTPWRGFALMAAGYSPGERHSCWHLLWEVPVWTGVDVAVATIASAIVLPQMAPVLP